MIIKIDLIKIDDKLKESLIYLYPKNKYFINRNFDNLQINDTIILLNNKILFNTYNYNTNEVTYYCNGDKIIEYVKLLKKLDSNCEIIKVNSFEERLIISDFFNNIKINYFDDENYDYINKIYYMIISSSEIIIVPNCTYNYFFSKFKLFEFKTYVRNIKIKRINGNSNTI